MRAFVPFSSWLNRTSRDLVADTSRTGTLTRPKLMLPVQMALGTCPPPLAGSTSLTLRPTDTHRRRPLTMVRYPNGIAGESFFEKRCPSHAPSWVATGTADPDLTACLVDDLPTLVWVANLASLELHTPQATVDDAAHPTSMVFD